MELKIIFGYNSVKKRDWKEIKWKISDDARVYDFCVTNLTIVIERIEMNEKKKCSSYYNEKISDDARVSEFCVTNLTIVIERIEINGWKEKKKERKTVLLIIMKKYPTMLESLHFVSQK